MLKSQLDGLLEDLSLCPFLPPTSSPWLSGSQVKTGISYKFADGIQVASLGTIV